MFTALPSPSRPVNRLADWAERRPVLFGFAMLMSLFVLYGLTQLLMGSLSGKLSPDVLNVLASAVVSLGFAVLTTAMGWWREAGFRAPRSWRDLRVLWLPALAVVSIYRGVHVGTTSEVLLLVAAAVLTGFLEEVIWRGLVMRALLPSGVNRAVLLSSVLFAAMHLSRLLGGAALSDTLVQLVIATTTGIFMAAITLRTGSIWPGILYHTLHDLLVWVGHGGLTGTIEPTPTFMAIVLGGQAVLFIYGLILLRGMRAGKDGQL